MESTAWSTPTALMAGVAGGALFVALAYAFPRRTRGILTRGLIVAALFYVYFAIRAHAGPAWIATEFAGVAAYGAIGWRGLRGSGWWLAAGWALHPLWDITVHLVGPGHAFAPPAYALACLTWDPVVAIAIAAGMLLHTRRGADNRPLTALLRTE